MRGFLSRRVVPNLRASGRLLQTGDVTELRVNVADSRLYTYGIALRRFHLVLLGSTTLRCTKVTAKTSISLTDALVETGSIEAALQRYQSERVPEGHRLVGKARHLGSYLEGNQHQGPPPSVLPIEELLGESGRG